MGLTLTDLTPEQKEFVSAVLLFVPRNGVKDHYIICCNNFRFNACSVQFVRWQKAVCTLSQLTSCNKWNIFLTIHTPLSVLSAHSHTFEVGCLAGAFCWGCWDLLTGWATSLADWLGSLIGVDCILWNKSCSISESIQQHKNYNSVCQCIYTHYLKGDASVGFHLWRFTVPVVRTVIGKCNEVMVAIAIGDKSGCWMSFEKIQWERCGHLSASLLADKHLGDLWKKGMD